MRRGVSFHQGCGCGCGGHGEGPGIPPSRDWAAAGDEEIVCHCGQVTKRAIVEAIELGAYTLPLLKTLTGAGRGKRCAETNPRGESCEADLATLLERYRRPSPYDPSRR